ncbi:MAG: hypothetical protein AB7O62_09320 [Pirellulales bacterium]
MSRFEIHSATAVAATESLAGQMPWSSDTLPDAEPCANEWHILSIGLADGPVWLRIDPVTGELARTAKRPAALAELRVISRRGGELLTLLPLADDILVNAESVDDFRVLNVRDTLVLSPGGPLSFITERFAPYIGPPTEAMLSGKTKCPMCQLPFEKEARVLACRCGCVMHFETAESHPHLSEDDRLECATGKKFANCLSCGRALAFEPYLVWDPTEL